MVGWRRAGSNGVVLGLSPERPGAGHLFQQQSGGREGRENVWVWASEKLVMLSALSLVSRPWICPMISPAGLLAPGYCGWVLFSVPGSI